MGLTHLDAGVVIGLLDAADSHHAAATLTLSTQLRAGNRLAMAASAYAECLVGPSRSGPEAVAVVRDLVARLPIEVVPLDSAIAEEAAALRARRPSLRLPDALVLATAAACSADLLVTTDRRWPDAKTLGLTTTTTTL